ncbi:MAG: hypothetical protein WBN75_20565 [Verrucomicrobiia bacterium]
MKAVGILAVLLAAASLGAQTNEIIPVLSADGQFYTNACITHTTPVSALIEYDGGSVQIALSNLPPALQRKFGYDPAKAAQYLADKKQQEIAARAAAAKRQADYETAIASLAGTSQPIRILSVNGDAGFLKCAVQTREGTREVCVNHLPDSIGDFISRLNQLRSDVAAYEKRVDNYDRAASIADAVTPPPGIKGSMNYNGQRAQANQMATTAADMQKQLAKMKADLAAMESAATNKTTVLAYPTGQSWGGFEIWECTGFAVRP